MISIFSYYGTENLGDAIQAVAMMELLDEMGVSHGFRERDSGFGDGDVMLASGYLDGRWKPASGMRHLFAGVYCQSLGIAEKVAKHASGPVGCRDPWTLELMRQVGVEAELIGCATLTLKRPEQKRRGVLRHESSRQEISKTMPWPSQYWKAMERIALLCAPVEVEAHRLHIILPCLALGTPVTVRKEWLNFVPEPQRFSLLDAMNFQYGEREVMNVSEWVNRYRTFVKNALEASGTLTSEPKKAV